jgi:hypothetical protein
MENPALPSGMDPAFLARLLDALSEIVIAVDADARVSYVNRGARQAFRRDEAAMLGKHLGEAMGCLHAEDKGCGNSAWCPCGLHEHVAEALGGDAPVLRETLGLPIRMGDVIEVRSFKVTLLPLAGADGKTRACVLMDDRTQIVRRSDELRLLQGKMEMRIGQCESMAEMISQDVRAPLLRLLEALRACPGAGPSDSQLWDLDLLALSSDNLLRLSQMDPEGIPVSKEVFDPGPAVAEMARGLREAALRRGVTLECPEPGADLPLVSADRKLFLRTLENLLRNAVDQTRPGGTVRLEAAAGGRDHVAIAVVFDGDAFPPEHLENIFEAFFHLERPGGLGQRNRGLPFARIAALAQGGFLRAENREGGRVAYVLALPSRRRTGTPPPGPAAPPPAAPPAGPPAPPLPPAAPPGRP